MPYCATEEEFVLRYRRQLEAQSKKQTVPALEQDERGVAFSTADGRSAAFCQHQTCDSISSQSEVCVCRQVAGRRPRPRWF